MFALGRAAAAAVVVLALSWKAEGQDTNDGYHPHAAFAFIRTGERTPVIRPGLPVLTALGAQQMYQLGQGFRTRYISGDSPKGLGIQRMEGLSTDVLDNNQIHVQTLDTQYLVSSAQAFMQGLYPPHSRSNGAGNGTGLLANGSAIEYPLGGYQYANIQAVSTLDPGSLDIQGNQNCPYAERDVQMWFTTEQFKASKATNDELYERLALDWSAADLNKYQRDFTYAVKRFDYLSYKYAHDREVFETLANDTSYTGVYDTLRYLADEEAWNLWGNVSHSSGDTSMRATAGKTLAAAILSQFQKLIIDRLSPGDTSATSYPLTFFFGEMEPIISLVSLMMLEKHDPDFRSMPAFGSAMLFELFSTGANSSFPTSQDDLWVRFYFHNGTAYPNQLTAYPTFGYGPSKTDMPWSEFKSALQGIMMDTLNEWCQICASPSLFCWGVDSDTTFVITSPKSAAKLSATIAGVIGAVSALAVAGLIFGLAMLVGGVRLHWMQRGKKSELGGFKGSAKLASDADVKFAKSGAPPAAGIVSYGGGDKKGHERVGSWELRQKEFGADLADQSARESFEAFDALGMSAVEPLERV